MKQRKLAALLAGLLCLQMPVVSNAKEQVIPAKAAEAIAVEALDRSLTAVNTGSGMLVSWRYLANDAADAVFRLYRDGNLIYTSNAGDATCYLDKDGNASSQYKVEYLVGNAVKGSDGCKIISNNSYLQLPLNPPSGSGCTYSPNDCSVGDVDGDGQYEIFLKWDPSNSQDNSKSGTTGKVYIDCLKLDGTHLWRIDLGINIRAGAHYTQMMVGDFDSDGSAELVCKTSDGTVDGTGKVIGNANADYRNSNGYVLTGNEYLTLFDGKTGAALDTINYNPGRGTVSQWGDSYGNRVDRFLCAVMYLDADHPSPVTVRGYYTRMTACAYDVVNKKLVQRWLFDTGNNSSAPGYGDGNHNCMPADVDGDGKQELVLGAVCLDDDGSVLWCTNLGHGDAMHLGDLDPSRPGLELWLCHEVAPYGYSLHDAATGEIIFRVTADKDTGRCGADNVWSGNDGGEFWGSSVYDAKGNTLSCKRPALNFFCYWDGDLEREILDGTTDSPATITDMGADGNLRTLLTTTGYYTCNSTKGTPCLSADLFGDWREEVIVRAADHKSIRIYATTYDTDYRVTTLMHDPQYRNQVAGQNAAYNQPPHLSYYMGSETGVPDGPTVDVGTPTGGKVGAVMNTDYKYTFTNAGSGLYLEVAGAAAAAGTDVVQGDGTSGGNLWKLVEGGNGYYYVISTLADGNTYYLDLDYGKVDNGTNIAIWTNTASDAQLFKFVDNGDGTYLITTKATNDQSTVGITGGSTAAGASAIQWECDGSANQSWIATMVIDPIYGELAAPVQPLDVTYAPFLRIDDSLTVGDTIFGDRDFTFTAVAEALVGAEYLVSSCDAKYATGDLATVTAASDMTLYVGFDDRLATIPAWAVGFTKTDMTCTSSNDVIFHMYALDMTAGETVTLGAQGQSASVVGYMAMMVKSAEVTTTTTTSSTTSTSTTTTTTTDPVSATLYGDVNCDGTVKVGDVILLNRFLAEDMTATVSQQGTVNADCDGVAGVGSGDAVAILALLASLVDSLPLR